MKKIMSSMYDFAIVQYYTSMNLVKIGLLVLRRGPKIIRDLKKYPWILTLLKVNGLIRRIVKNRTGRYRLAVVIIICNVVDGILFLLGEFFFRSKRLVLHEDMVPPEIMRAMGLSLWMPELLGILLPMIDPHAVEKYIDVCENSGIPADVCSLPKSTLGMVLSGEMPPGLAAVASNLPCDGGMASYAILEETMGIPVYRLDIPHNFYNERAEKYFADELMGMIQWLEEKTPGKMDWEKLKEICERRNEMAAIELELWEMMRSRPAPMAAEAVYLSHLWAFNVIPGSKKALKLLKKIKKLAEKNYEEEIPAVKNEEYRAILWNPPFLHFIDLFRWAEEEYGVNLLNDSMSYNHQRPVDTTSRESMLRGLGNIIMQGPMARHTRGPAENYIEDIFVMRKYFNADMIWVASHVGCKNTAAMNGVLRERCRREKIPLLLVEYDLSDPRIESHEGIKDQVRDFMETVMKSGDKQKLAV